MYSFSNHQSPVSSIHTFASSDHYGHCCLYLEMSFFPTLFELVVSMALLASVYQWHSVSSSITSKEKSQPNQYAFEGQRRPTIDSSFHYYSYYYYHSHLIHLVTFPLVDPMPLNSLDRRSRIGLIRQRRTIVCKM